MTSDSKSPGPSFAPEQAARTSGARIICGVDEVGRGPLAGPVVVAAVILPDGFELPGLNDSKLVSPALRERLYDEIAAAAAFSVISAPPKLIAERNILNATLWAMRQAVLALPGAVDHALIDGNIVPKGLPCAATALVGGDGLSMSIAAASIIAKVTRDRMCLIMHDEEPHFGFASHKGYAAPVHMSALTAHGPGRHHRMDFAPCRVALVEKTSREASSVPVNLTR
jgi:ribonuclease HII